MFPISCLLSNNQIPAAQKTAVALGNFDGLHIGHAAVIQAAAEQRAAGLTPVVLKFKEHPEKTLTGHAPRLLLTDAEEEARIRALGAEIVYADFAAVMDFSPEEFVDRTLVRELRAAFVSCGYNYRFGRQAAGTAALLRTLCASRGVRAHVSEKVVYQGAAVSSTAIRAALRDGDLALADGMLGYAYGYDFEVVHGDARGRLLGAPTINQFFPETMLVPKYGVYASLVAVDGKTYVGVTNIGLRPTVGGSRPRSETYIEQFSGDLYGKRPRVTPMLYMRPEIKFASLDALSRQIAEDAAQAAAYIKTTFPDMQNRGSME